MGKRERKVSRFTGHWITEQGAGTVEYVIVLLAVIKTVVKPLVSTTGSVKVIGSNGAWGTNNARNPTYVFPAFCF